MTNEFENDALGREATDVRSLNIESANAALRSGISDQYQAPKPISFNGLLTNKLLTALPGADFARLMPHFEPVSLFAGQDLYRYDEPVDFIYFPETAVISHIYLLEDGSSTEAAIIGREGMIGLSVLLDSNSPSHWTQVTVGGSALRIRARVLRNEFNSGGPLQKLLLAYTGLRLEQLSQRAICNGRHKLEERLCAWLLMIADRTVEVALPLTHEAMAHHLGARRAGITEVCNELRSRGILDYHRGMVRILNRQQLEDCACECYRALLKRIEQR